MQEIVHKFTKNIPGHVKPHASHVLGFEIPQAGIYPKHPTETMSFFVYTPMELQFLSFKFG